MTSADITRVQPAEAPRRPGFVCSLRATWRLVTLAVARLRRRRGPALLSASGAGLAVAMLTAALIVGAGVEDKAFSASISTHTIGGLERIERSNGFYVVARIPKDAPAVRRFVNGRLRREGLSFQASAFIAQSALAFVAMSDDLAANFVLLSGRLPRRCTPGVCEYVQNAPGPGALG